MKTISKEHQVSNRPHPVGSGVQLEYKFPNGYGASVVQFLIGPFGGSYGAENGLWELAVLGPDRSIDYDTPITDDVLGHLTEAEVNDALALIAALPVKGQVSA